MTTPRSMAQVLRDADATSALADGTAPPSGRPDSLPSTATSEAVSGTGS